jgi:replication factor A1
MITYLLHSTLPPTRVILSDGVNYIQSMLATQLNKMVDSKEIDKNTLLKLTGFATNVVSDRR